MVMFQKDGSPAYFAQTTSKYLQGRFQIGGWKGRI